MLFMKKFNIFKINLNIIKIMHLFDFTIVNIIELEKSKIYNCFFNGFHLPIFFCLLRKNLKSKFIVEKSYDIS